MWSTMVDFALLPISCIQNKKKLAVCSENWQGLHYYGDFQLTVTSSMKRKAKKKGFSNRVFRYTPSLLGTCHYSAVLIYIDNTLRLHTIFSFQPHSILTLSDRVSRFHQPLQPVTLIVTEKIQLYYGNL